jgi:ABC-type branched-subunit amino acid transport system substrate-binding protein
MLRRTLVAVAATIPLVVIASCGDDDSPSTPTPTSGASGSETPNVNLPPAEGVVIFGSPDTTNSALQQAIAAGAPPAFFVGDTSRDDASFAGVELPAEAGFLGTTLVGTGSADFDAAYEETFGVSPNAFPGIREAYDAVYVAALAAVAANNAGPAEIESHLHYVANSPGQIATFGSDAFAEARTALEANGDVNYIGASGQVDLTASGDISKGQTEVWRIFGGQILGQEFRDVDLAAEVGADVPTGALSRAVDEPSGPLRIGALLPPPGDEATALQDAMQLAVDEINLSGGVFGFDVELVVDSPEPADVVSSAESLAGETSIILGPFDEASAQLVADEYANPTSVTVVTLATSPALSINADEGFWRLSASSLLQTPVLANLAVEAEIESLCIIHEPNPASTALANAFKAAFEHKGGGVRALVQVAEGMDLSACLGT